MAQFGTAASLPPAVAAALASLNARLGGGASGECAGLGCSGGGADTNPPPYTPSTTPAVHAADFLASLGPPPPPAPPPPPPPPPPPRASGFDVGPTGEAAAKSEALARALQIASSLATSLSTAPRLKTLDELLARDRARIAAADERNLAYVLEQAAAAKARARAAAEAAERPAKVARTGVSTSSAGGGAACSVYVSGLPRAAPGVSVGELQAHFAQVGPVVRVKVYKDGEGRPKGDALVVYEKEASVFGALQLLSGRELRVGVALAVERAVFADHKDAAPAAAASAATTTTTACRRPAWREPSTPALCRSDCSRRTCA